MHSQRQLNAVTIVTKVQLIDKTNNIPWTLDPHYCSHKSQVVEAIGLRHQQVHRCIDVRIYV